MMAGKNRSMATCIAAVLAMVAPASPTFAQGVPAGAQAPAAEAQAAPAEPATAIDCSAVQAERVRLQAALVQARRSISDIAFNRPQHRRKVGAGDVGRAAAGTAASVLLPFG